MSTKKKTNRPTARAMKLLQSHLDRAREDAAALERRLAGENGARLAAEEELRDVTRDRERIRGERDKAHGEHARATCERDAVQALVRDLENRLAEAQQRGDEGAKVAKEAQSVARDAIATAATLRHMLNLCESERRVVTRALGRALNRREDADDVEARDRRAYGG